MPHARAVDSTAVGQKSRIDSDYRRQFRIRLMTIVRGGPVVLALGGCGAKTGLGLPIPGAAAGSGGAGGSIAGNGGMVGAGGSVFVDASLGGTGAGGSGGTGGIIDAGSGGTGGIADASTCDAATPGNPALTTYWCTAAPSNGSPCPSPCTLLGCFMTGSMMYVSAADGPYKSGGDCCYNVTYTDFPCYVGRTFFIDEGVVTAELREGRAWTTEHLPDVSGLDAATRRALGEAWARDGLFEHASVASFARFAMQLLGLGAPARLVQDTLAANLDEVNHAEMCLALAAAYLGHAVEPARLPLPSAVPAPTDLAEVAFETAMEGCIGETVATLQALDALERTTDPAVRAVLEKTVEDEARHAELAWRFMAWALEVGDARVHDAVARAFAAFRPPEPRVEDLRGVDLEAYAGHGRQTAVEARAVAERILRETVAPCATALLATRDRFHAPCTTATTA